MSFDVGDYFSSLEKAEVIILRRPDFLADDFEYESYLGLGIMKNCFKEKRVDNKVDDILISFPERWLNIIERRMLFHRISLYYPNLKRLTIKTHCPILIGCVPSKHAMLLKAEDEITRTAKEGSEITSMSDPTAIFSGISEGKLFVV